MVNIENLTKDIYGYADEGEPLRTKVRRFMRDNEQKVNQYLKSLESIIHATQSQSEKDGNLASGDAAYLETQPSGYLVLYSVLYCLGQISETPEQYMFWGTATGVFT